MDERDDVLGLAIQAREQLEPIATHYLAAKGFYEEATRINAARIALDHLVRQAKYEERRGQDAERATARLQFLLRKLFTAEDECHGSVSTMPDKWLEAWNALRAEIGMEVKE